MSIRFRLRSIPRGAALLMREPREFFKRLKSYYTKSEAPVVADESETTLYTEVSAQCNNRCSFCSIDKVKRSGYIKDEVKNKVRDLIISNPARRFRVYFHVVGEPLLYSGLEEYIKLLTLPNADLWVCTNGTILDDARLNSLRNAGLKNIWFSMFYTNQKDYKKYTRSNNFLITWENLRHLLSKSETFKRIHIVTFSRNAEAIKEMVAGKDNVTLETDRVKQVWEYDNGARPNFISISIDGDVNFNWEDYNFKTSIGNICDLPSGTIITKFEDAKRVK